jgi:stage IV sporulation protein FB
MQFDGDSKDNPLDWRLPVGSLFGIRIFIHLFFLFGAAIIFGLALRDAPNGYVVPSLVQTAGVFGILFFVVLVHEFGHCFGARATGGEATEILLWPLGGLAFVQPVHVPRAHLITALAGPAVNVVFCLISAGVLIAVRGAGSIPLNPFTALNACWLILDPFARWTAVFFAINYYLLLFNLLPIYPLDGGRVLHALLWPKRGFQKATMAATYVGMIGAVALAVVGLLTGASILLMIAIFGGLTCYADRRALRMQMLEGAGEFGYDFSQGYAAFDDEPEVVRKPGFLERRRIAKAEAERERQAEQSRKHREEVDRILAKVHREGINALNPEEHAILQQETQRQRSDGE